MKFQRLCGIMKTEKRFNKAAYDSDFIRTHYDRMTVQVRKGTKDRWKAKATEEGKSLNRFILDIVESYIYSHGKED